MAQHPIFDISPEQIAALDDEGLRLLIARLCEAELRRRGLPPTAVLYGGNQIAADGGIDVRVELPADTAIFAPIPRPVTAFQAKTEAMSASKIEDEMRPRPKIGRRKTTGPGHLRQSIRDLANEAGAYIIVSSKDSTTDSMLRERRNAMSSAVADLDHREALQLDFYDRQRMATWVRDYPGEILWLRARIGQSIPGWHPFGNWSRVPPGADSEYLSDNGARLRDMSAPQDDPLPIADGIARLRSLLTVPGGIVRLTGLSGTGKTRLLEALFDPRIGDRALDPSWAVYADIGHGTPWPSQGQLAEQLAAEGKRAVMVLDNCPRETHDAIAPVCRSAEGSLSLITLDLDIRDETPEGTDVFRLQNASEAVMETLLARRFPALSRAVHRRIAQLSDGNARIALLIAEETSQEAPGTNLADLGDDELFRRLFYQKKGESDELLRAAEVLALVYSFDGEASQGDSAELPLLARIGGLDTRALFRAMGELSRRDILQSRGRWRAILPQPLATRLAKWALANLPALEVAQDLWQHPRLIKSFAHRLSYLHDSPEAQRIAAAWLAPGGPLSDLRPIVQSWNDVRMDLVAYIAPVAPEAVLDLIERFAAGCEAEDIKWRRLPYRHRLMVLLRKLAWFPEHFRPAVLSLARFVRAEQAADTRRQGSRYLEELFWPTLSGTRAGPQERIGVLEELLSAPDQAVRDTGLVALRGMLHTGTFSSSHDFSFGGRPVDYGWHPKTRADCEQWFGAALAVARRLALSDSLHSTTVRSILAESFRELWCRWRVFDQAQNTVLEIRAAQHWPEGWHAVRKTLALDSKRMEASLVAQLKAIEERLAPQSVEDRVRSYVLAPGHEITRIAILEVEHSEDPADHARKPEQAAPSAPDYHEVAHRALMREVHDLGRQCAKEPALFEHLWSELFSHNAHQAYCFGQGLAEASTDIAASWTALHGRFKICDLKRRDARLLRGFLAAAAAEHRESVEGFLDDAIRDTDLGPVLPYLQMSVGIGGKGARRLLAAAEVGLAPSGMYANLTIGRVTDTIPPSELSCLLLGLTRQPKGYEVAAQILSMHFYDPQKDRGPWDPALLYCGRQLLAGFPLDHANDYELALIAKACLACADTASDAQLLCDHIRDADRVCNSHTKEVDELLAVLLELHSHVALTSWIGTDAEAWANITHLFVVPGRNPLKNVPASVLLDWANKEPQTRYFKLATAIPLFDREEDDISACWSEAALALLGSAPDRETVFQSLVSGRIYPSVWSGSLADILEQRRSLLSQFLDDPNPAIAQAARELDKELQQEIPKRRLFEHNRERERDERFE